MKDTRTWEKDDSLITEIAERIVIEYANLSGRESENRSYVREASRNVLPYFLDQARKDERERIKEFILPKVQKFIDKVESGMARSKETYADMKDIKQFIDSL